MTKPVRARPAASSEPANGTVSTAEMVEVAVLAAAPIRPMAPRVADEHVAELASLADTAGAEVCATIMQRMDAPHPKFFLGEGKVEELKALVERRSATLVIFDEDLSPSQGKNLEDRLGVRIMDRTELILDIFATRARSAEAQMQVELAQLQYMLPRLKRMWTHLSRIRGGIGFRGPGETQLETDRRLIGRRIRDLRRKLDGVARQRATQRKGRKDEYRAALVGYTNAGKSSILSGLSGSDVFVEDRLFATLDPTTRAVELVPGTQALVTDTVGFIRRLPHHLVASFRATLEEAVDTDILLHVVDAAHSAWEEHTEVVEGVLGELGLADHPTLMVFNKVDRLTHAEEDAFRNRVAALYPGRSLLVSAVEPGGLDALRTELHERLRARRPMVHLEVAVADGRSLAAVYQDGEVLSREQDGASIRITARLPEATLGRLRQAGVRVASAS